MGGFDSYSYNKDKTNIFVFREVRDRFVRFKNYESVKVNRKLNQDDFLEVLLNLYLKLNPKLEEIIKVGDSNK